MLQNFLTETRTKERDKKKVQTNSVKLKAKSGVKQFNTKRGGNSTVTVPRPELPSLL